MRETTDDADENERLSVAIVRAIAAVSNTAVGDVQPLSASIDPEAVDRLFQGRSTEGRVLFDHAGFRVTVRSTGKICLREDNEV